MFLLKKFCKKRENIGLKNVILLMFSSRGNNGYVTKTDVLYKTINFCRNLQNILLFNFVNTSKPQKLSARPNYFWELGS